MLQLPEYVNRRRRCKYRHSEHINKKNAVIVNLICCGAATAQSVY